jgi:hypothetical protein
MILAWSLWLLAVVPDFALDREARSALPGSFPAFIGCRVAILLPTLKAQGARAVLTIAPLKGGDAPTLRYAPV